MPSPREILKQFAEKQKRLVAGLMSGTSIDSIDVAFCEFEGKHGQLAPDRKISIKHFVQAPWPADIKEIVRNASKLSIRELAELDLRVGKVFAEALKHAAKTFGVALTEIDLVGSHGQTVYHHSSQRGIPLATLQIGCGDTLAAELGLAVVSDFRRRDIALGGQGAPLTPYADFVLFRGLGTGAAVLNLGGIANITVISATPDKLIGFDTGPANAPIDRLVRRFSGGKRQFDQDGALGRKGKVNERLLQHLLAGDLYLVQPAPKSTGFEMYGDSFVEELVVRHGKIDEDLIATATEFVAKSIAEALKLPGLKGAIKEIVLAGGGSRNAFLVERIKAALNGISVKLSDDLGVPGDAREAAAFAILAHDSALGWPVSWPNITGCRAPTALGKFSFP